MILSELNQSEFLEVIKAPVKSLDSKTISYGSSVLDREVLEVKRSVKGSLYISNMVMLEVTLKGYHSLLGEWVNYKRTIASHEVLENQEFEIDYGLFKVLEQDYDDDTQETKLIAFDKMINTQKEYKREDFALTYPATIKQVFDRALELCDLETDNLVFPNMNETVDEEVWHNTEYTYRDVLTHISQVAGVTINIKDNKVHIKQPTDIDFTITADKLQKLKIGEDYGSINILNLTREPQHDNYAFPTNWTEIPLDNRKELVFENNPIIDKRREYFAPLIFDKINNLQYKEMVADTFGFGIFEIGDIVKVEEYNTGLTHEVVVTEEISTHKHQLISEVTSDKPTTSKEEYVVVTDERRQGQRTYILVDQLNGKIELAVTDINGLNDKYAQIEIDLDEIKQTVSNIDTTNNVIPNFQGYNGYKGWSWVGGSLKAVTGLTAMVGLRQSTNWIRRAVDSDAIYRLEFFTSGRAISPKGFVTGGEEYSYNTRVHHGTQGYTLTVREFDALDGAVQHETPFAIDTNELNPYFTFTLQPSTRYVDLEYDIPTTVTPTNTLSVTEQVFNEGRPGEFAFSVAEFVNKTESQISQLSDSVTTTVTKVETIDGQVIENTSRISQNATNIALKANTIDLQGKVGFTDLSTQGRTNIVGDNITTGKIKADRIDFNNAKGSNVDLSGKITATSGQIGGYAVSGTNLVGNDITLESSRIRIGTTYLRNFVSGGRNYLRVSGNSIFDDRLQVAGTISTDTFLETLGDLRVQGSGVVNNTLTVFGNFKTHGSKNAVVPTRDGLRAIDAYETAQAHFGDIQEVYIDKELVVEIDVIFGDTIHLEDYHVFTTAYGNGNVWVEDRNEKTFTIKTSTPMNVSYEIKGVRRGYRDKRLVDTGMTYQEYNKQVGDNRD